MDGRLLFLLWGEAKWVQITSGAADFHEHGVVCCVTSEVFKRNRELECAESPVLRFWDRLHCQIIANEFNEVGRLAICCNIDLIEVIVDVTSLESQ